MRLLFFTSSPNLTLRAPGRRRCPGVIRVWGRGERQGGGLPPGGLSTAQGGSEAPHSPSLPVPRRRSLRGRRNGGKRLRRRLRPTCALFAPYLRPARAVGPSGRAVLGGCCRRARQLRRGGDKAFLFAILIMHLFYSPSPPRFAIFIIHLFYFFPPGSELAWLC